LHLKKSLGLVRGKNDKVDAIRITGFIEKNYTELPRWKCPSSSVQKLKVLLAERNHRVKVKKQFTSQQTGYAKMKSIKMDKDMLRLNKQVVETLNKQIKVLEEQIEQLINTDELMKKQAVLMRSVPGVGKVLSSTLLAKTSGFTSIESPRKLACYCGVVPFDHQSGTSIRGRNRVSVYADKSLKSLLHLAAMSAIRLKNDLRAYYLRKVAEGKNKMSVLNAVRNKIIHRIYAVIKNQTPYTTDLVLS
jgi:transposase